MIFKSVFLTFYLVLFVSFCLIGCKEDEKSKTNKDKNATLENNATSFLNSKTKEEEISQESPLQQQLKKNLKSHLNDLSRELQDKNLNHLQLEQNTGMQKHIERFESLHGRKDIPKNHSSQESLNQKIQKAYNFQQERIEELRQKNDEISK
ncbi:hypothetical protein [Helicobacter sp.]|uniref:hypothetical protein n=1 Tax=Helicobacter sp. TaxID=218 RepID=UPI0025C73271|nr:hypothetical protein [Helicobacter sp.]